MRCDLQPVRLNKIMKKSAFPSQDFKNHPAEAMTLS